MFELKYFKDYIKLCRIKGKRSVYSMGKISNYPICDIIWFFIRNFFGCLYSSIFGYHPFYKWCIYKNGKFYLGKGNKVTNILYEDYQKSLEYKYHHIVCPICHLRNIVFNKIPVYKKCKNCNNTQLFRGQTNCKGCGKIL